MKFLFVLLFCVTGVLRAQDSASQLAQATEHLKNERFEEALALAAQVAAAEPGNYQAHYYVALAELNLDKVEAAAAAAQQALDLAPESAKPAVGKLVALIQGRRSATSGSTTDADGKAAEAALSDGSKAKAARLFDKAWSAGQNNPEYGLKAADLYANVLGQPVDAARLLRQVQSGFRGTPYAERAATQLARIAVELRRLAWQYLAESGSGKSNAEFRVTVAKAVEADPGLLQAYAWRAHMESIWDMGAGENLKQAVQDLARHDLATIEVLSALPNIKQRLANPEFAEFLKDILGAKDFATLAIQTNYYDTQMLFKVVKPAAIVSANDLLNGQPVRIVTDVATDRLGIDGVSDERTKSSYLVFGLKPGEHRLEISVPGKKAYKTTIQNQAGNQAVVYQYNFAELARKNIACRVCSGEGHVDEKCDDCHGKGYKDCPDCDGEGRIPIYASEGNRVVRHETCPGCGGQRHFRCNDCDGRGYFRHDCATCGGEGKVSALQLQAS